MQTEKIITHVSAKICFFSSGKKFKPNLNFVIRKEEQKNRWAEGKEAATDNYLSIKSALCKNVFTLRLMYNREAENEKALFYTAIDCDTYILYTYKQTDRQPQLVLEERNDVIAPVYLFQKTTMKLL